MFSFSLPLSQPGIKYSNFLNVGFLLYVNFSLPLTQPGIKYSKERDEMLKLLKLFKLIKNAIC